MRTIIVLIPLLASCSVMMAAGGSGAKLETIERAAIREDLIACGASLISTEEEEGKRVDLFRIPKENRSMLRAAVNGLLDISTAFLWEFAGTPIEIAMEKDAFYIAKVTFSDAGEIEKIEVQ